MKKLSIAIMLLLLAAPLGRAGNGLYVVTTTPDLGAVAREVLGDAGEVYVIARTDQDPHYVQAKPSHMVKMRRADAIVYVGLELEIGWLPKLLEGARNPQITPGRIGNIDASKAITRILEIPTGEVDRGWGDIHPKGNPHYMLDPRNGVKVATLLAEKFAALDPPKAQLYRGNAAKFAAAMRNKMAAWSDKIALLKGKKIIAYHKQWEYLADWLDLDVVAYIENRPGIPPTAKHIMEVEKLVKSSDIHVIIKANYMASKAPEKLAGRTGIVALTLPATVTGEDGVNTYRDMFDVIISELAKAQK